MKRLPIVLARYGYRVTQYVDTHFGKEYFLVSPVKKNKKSDLHLIQLPGRFFLAY